MNAIELLSSGSAWTDIRARAVFPILLKRAIQGSTITYGDLNTILVGQGFSSALAIAYRYPAGKIGDLCEALSRDLDEEIPPLNAIIVNQSSQLPSHGVDGYLRRFLGLIPGSTETMSRKDRDSYAEQAIQTAFEYSGWRRVARHFGVPLPKSAKTATRRGGIIPAPNQKKFATGPESEAHARLKVWVAEHPQIFNKIGNFKKGSLEKVIASGDRLDVLFVRGKQFLAVEVKTTESGDDEVQRGIYQCVKYRATLRAMQLASLNPPNAQSVLVLDGAPSIATKRLAARLSVVVFNVFETMK